MGTIVTMDDVRKHAEGQLAETYKLFKQSPSSFYWNRMLRAMLVHQQAHELPKVSNTDGRTKLLVQLETLPRGEWDEAIVKAATRMGINQALEF